MMHAKTVEDLPGTLGLLQEIYDTAEVRAGGKPWFVLIEKQPLDDESWKKGLIFNTQLEYTCSTFFTMKGKEVRLVEPQKRYEFLGIHNFRKMSRHDRKKAVARKVTELLQTSAPGLSMSWIPNGTAKISTGQTLSWTVFFSTTGAGVLC